MNTNKAMMLADVEFAKYNLRHWRFKLDNAKGRAGLCSHNKHTISMSKPIIELNEEQEFMNTLLHEIAHAIVGREHGHDYAWRETCIAIGGDGKRCFTASELNVPKGKWKLICKKCGREVTRHRKSKSATACRECCRIYNNNLYSDDYKMVYKLNN